MADNNEKKDDRIYTFCPECGFNVKIDEDGLCAMCGATAIGSAVDALNRVRVTVRSKDKWGSVPVDPTRPTVVKDTVLTVVALGDVEGYEPGDISLLVKL